jgi:hypothetical protein
MKQFLVESFGETVFIWHHVFNNKIVKKEKPDIVIQIVGERGLDAIQLAE